jgi:hypothetical protein
MTLSPKLELLGAVSERARELEDPDRPLLHVEHDVVERLSLVRETRLLRQSGHVDWAVMREQLVELLAAGVNWILAGDAAAAREAGVG